MMSLGASAACPAGRALPRTVAFRRAAVRAVLIVAAALALFILAEAAHITITGAWTRTIGPGDLQNGPGSGLVATYESPAGQITMRISGAGNQAWRVDILRIDSAWHPDLVLSIRRTGNGTGRGTVAGGTAYLPVLTTSRTFVTGSGNISGIPLQEQLSGVSISIPVGTYATTIHYTVVDQRKKRTPMMRRSMTKTRKALALFVFSVLFSPLAGRAQVGVTNGLTQEKVCRPGESFQSFIAIRNYSAEAQDVRIYQADYSFSFDGKSRYDAPGQASRSNAAWITPGRKRLTIPGSSQVDLHYTAKVPDDPALVGTYWSVIMVEAVDRTSAPQRVAGEKKPNVGINQTMRYAVQILTHIGDTGTRQIKFLKTELVQDQDLKVVHFDVENVGERWVRPYASLEIYDQKGELAGKFEGERLRIFPGTSVRFMFDVSRIAAGRYKALFVLDNKDSYVFGAQYALDLSAAGKDAAGL